MGIVADKLAVAQEVQPLSYINKCIALTTRHMQANQAKTPCPNCKEVRVHKFQGIGDVDDKRNAVIELWKCECCNRNYYRVRTKDNKNIGFFKDIRDWKQLNA